MQKLWNVWAVLSLVTWEISCNWYWADIGFLVHRRMWSEHCWVYLPWYCERWLRCEVIKLYLLSINKLICTLDCVEVSWCYLHLICLGCICTWACFYSENWLFFDFKCVNFYMKTQTCSQKMNTCNSIAIRWARRFKNWINCHFLWKGRNVTTTWSPCKSTCSAALPVNDVTNCCLENGV